MKQELFTFGSRVALVTGGSGSIGLAIGRRFAQAGLEVALLGSNPARLRHAAEQLHADGLVASTWACDLARIDTIDALLQSVKARHGSIDILVNCAGVLDLEPIEQTDETTWDNVLDVNLKASFFMVQKCLPHLRQGTSARIINISSNAGRMGGYANGMPYTASKGGLIALTYGLARKLAPQQITVNCVAPGTIESNMSRARDAATHAGLLERFPIGRIGTPDEVAYAACYFASLESGFTTGAVLDVNGGMFMG